MRLSVAPPDCEFPLVLSGDFPSPLGYTIIAVADDYLSTFLLLCSSPLLATTYGLSSSISVNKRRTPLFLGSLPSPINLHEALSVGLGLVSCPKS